MKKRIFARLGKVTGDTRLCFDCDNEYTPRKGDLPLLYCPYCGKKTLGFDLESFERFDEYLQHFDNDSVDETLEYIDKFITCLEKIKNDLINRDN